nr:beta-aspartyl-peptidase [uncultured Mitsuokella sp.]
MKADTRFFTCLRHAHVYAPEDLGVVDLLLAGEKIACIGENLETPAGLDCEEIDLQGALVMPGMIDGHVHITGGGGEGGYHTRTPELMLSQITMAGVTTVCGLLGTDGTTRSVINLLAKARALETEGITSYIYTGAYELPTPTLTGSVRRDIVVIDKVIGAGEIAMSDHRSGQPSYEEYRKLAAEARVGGMISGKAGVINMHLGDGKRGIQYLFDIAAEGEIPRSQFLPTHANRNRPLFEQCIKWGKDGGFLDITSGINPNDPGSEICVKPAEAVREALDAGVPLKNITMSSDGGGSMPVFDEEGNPVGVGVGDEKTMLTELRDMIVEENILREKAIAIVTLNVANALKLHDRKGRLAAGMDADLLVLHDDYTLCDVWARGRQMVQEGRPVVKGTFES